MRQRFCHRFFGLAVVLVLVAAACVSGTEITEASVDTEAPNTEASTVETTVETEGPIVGTVTLWHGWTEREIESLDEVISAFRAVHPEVVVETRVVPFDDLRSTVTAAWATGEGPTVLLGASDWALGFGDADLVLDLATVISADVIAGLLSSAVDAVTFDGAILGLPHSLTGVVMYRNTSLMPEAPASLDDIIARGDAHLERGFFFSIGHLVTACGGAVANPDGSAAFAGAAGQCWLETLASFPGVEGEYYSENDVNAMKAGEASVIIDGTWNLESIVNALGEENVSIDPWPTAALGSLGGVMQAESVYVGSLTGGDELVATATFVEYFLGAEAQSILADPARAGHIPAFAGDMAAGRFQAQALAALTGGVALPRFGDCYWSNMDAALQAFFSASVDAATALADAAAAVDAAVAAGDCT